MRRSTLVLLAGCTSAIARGVPRAPSITLAPDPALVDSRVSHAEERGDINPISLARILLTALPSELVEVAYTNPGAVPGIISRQFFDGSTPAWFANLPPHIQTYLVEAFVGRTPSTAPASPTSAPTGEVPPSWSNSPSWSNPTPSTPTPSTPTPSTSTPSASTPSTPPSSSGTSFSTSAQESTSTPASETISSPTESPTLEAPPADPEASNAGLSKRAKIGIGLGVPLAVLGIAAIALFSICLRRRRNADRANTPPASAFFTPEQLHGGRRGGPYGTGGDDGFGPPFPFTNALGNLPTPPIGRRMSDPFEDPPSMTQQGMHDTVPAGAVPSLNPSVNHSQLPPLPLPPLRTGSGQWPNSRSSLEIIREVPDDSSPTLGASSKSASKSPKRRGSSSEDLSPISPISPLGSTFPALFDEGSPFRDSPKPNRSAYGLLPQNSSSSDSASELLQRQGSEVTARRKSLPRSSGGYRGLPSPHLERTTSPGQMLPPGDWIDDSETWPLHGRGWKGY